MGQEASAFHRAMSAASVPGAKSITLRCGCESYPIRLTDNSLTMGWLLSEAIRLNLGPETVVGLKTEEGADVMDVMLQSLSRNCAVLGQDERLEVVVAGKLHVEPVPGLISADHFRLLKVIGKGGYSTVVQARKKDTGHLYALKIMNKRQIMKEDKINQVLTELAILTRVHHPFVISLQYAFQSVLAT